MTDRRQKAAEVAMKRRRGASKAHSDKVRGYMLNHDDLYTTCQRCGQNIRGPLNAIMDHCRTCTGDDDGT